MAFWKKVIVIAFFCAAVSTLLANSTGVTQEDIDYYSDFKKCYQLFLDKADGSEVKEFADEMEGKWKSGKPKYYAEIMSFLCGVIEKSTFDPNNELRIKYSEAVMDNLGERFFEIPVIMISDILLLSIRNGQQLKVMSEASGFSSKRAIIASRFCLCLDKLYRQIDPEWNINALYPGMEWPIADQAYRFQNEHFRARYDRKKLDPNVLAEYEEYKKKSKKAYAARRRYDEQYDIRMMAERILPEFQDYLIALYSAPSFDSKTFRLDLFETDLNKTIKDTNIRKRILKFITTRRDQLYTLSTEKVIVKDLSSQLESIKKLEESIEIPDNKEITLRLKDALKLIRQSWKESHDLAYSDQVRIKKIRRYPYLYRSSLRLKHDNQTTVYRFQFSSGAREMIEVTKSMFSEGNEKEIREKGHKLSFFSSGLDLKRYIKNDGSEIISFYPGNKIKEYSLKLDGTGKSVLVSWDPEGRLKNRWKLPK